MTFFLQLLAIVAGILFPAFLVTAIKSEGEKATNYTALACVCFGYIVYTLIGSVS